MLVKVEKLIYGGDGLSRAEGEVILTPFVLPNESIEIEKEPKRSGVARGRVKEIVDASADRAAPGCRYFGSCGGCHYQHMAYPAQLAAKRAILAETLARVGKIKLPDEIPAISAEPYGYRNRIQLHFEPGRLGYRQARSNKLVPVAECPISSPKLNECISTLNQMVRDRRWLRFLQTAELFTDETSVQFNVMETARPLAKHFFDWCAERIAGFNSGPLEYMGYRVSHGSFFQVNRFLISALIDNVAGQSAGAMALDLYAGVGLFSIPLASRFAKVIAVESGTGAVRDLQFSAARSGVNVEARTESADVFLASFDAKPDLIIADPPRTGLGAPVITRMAALGSPEIRILSCDPATLARDASQLLTLGYTMGQTILIDLFPQTYHIETLATFLKV